MHFFNLINPKFIILHYNFSYIIIFPMRTLAKPPKTKKIEKEADKSPQKKASNKKITKTVFESPFTYKMYLNDKIIDRHCPTKLWTSYETIFYHI